MPKVEAVFRLNGVDAVATKKTAYCRDAPVLPLKQESLLLLYKYVFDCSSNDSVMLVVVVVVVVAAVAVCAEVVL